MSTSMFDRSNIQETPNPKPLSVQRVSVRISKGDSESGGTTEIGFIRNAQLDPAAHTGRG